MRKATHAFAVSGVALAAVLTMSAGPASAGTGAGPIASSTAADEERIAGYFMTSLECEDAGREGVRSREWGHFECTLDANGLRHGRYRLTVEGDGSRRCRPDRGGDRDHGWDRDRLWDRDRDHRCDRYDDRPAWRPLDGGLHGDRDRPGDDAIYIDNGDDLTDAHSPRRQWPDNSVQP